MNNILILGASGQIARWVIEMLADRNDVKLTLFLRNAKKQKGHSPKSERIVEGDVLDAERLNSAVAGQDIVYANLTSDDAQAKSIIAAMTGVGVKRLIFATSLGICDEVPGKFDAWNRREIGAYLPPFRRAADAIEASDLDYIVLRPAWLMDEDEVAYETTDRNQPFKVTEVSRNSVAALVVDIVRSASSGWVAISA